MDDVRCTTKGCRALAREDGQCRTCLADQVWRREDARPVLPESLEWLDLDRLEATEVVDGWQATGVCYQRNNTEQFYIERGDSSDPGKDQCGVCPAVYQCLRFVLANQTSSQDHGIWGNTSVLQRRRIRRALVQREAVRELTERCSA